MRTDWWIVLTLVLSATLAAGAEMGPLLVIEPGPGNPRNSEGDIIELKDGRLCLIYSRFTGGSGDDAAADLAMRISRDEGRTWSDDQIIEGNPDGWYCYTAVTFVKDRVLLVYCAGDKKIGGLNRLKVTALSRDSLSSVHASQTLCAWEFDSERELQVWRPNAHLANVTATNGMVKARAVDSDPFLLCRDVTIAATPHQYIVTRMKASRAGIAELFWSGRLEGQYGGLTEAKKLRFSVRDANHWQEIVLFPFWHTGYCRIDGRPAVFLWDPKAIRIDLGGSEAVREAFEKSQEMARDAGFSGITLIALGYDFSQGHIRALKEEGYSGITTYHEWGATIDGQVSRKLFRYEDVVRDSPGA